MRLSIKEDDPGYLPYMLACGQKQRVRIVLDGVEQKSVITADDETGEVLRHVLDDKGCAQIDPDDNESVWTELVRGNVTIEITDAVGDRDTNPASTAWA